MNDFPPIVNNKRRPKYEHIPTNLVSDVFAGKGTRNGTIHPR
ncbi:hypothetical protein THF1C08_370009 [Vibrio jasicida]|uniref:Uncharacterized protein n=1 Tax=Vibrio jasicida TaxID=766224 RepID=A0AAU9QSJ3_9VIBR|nr:hypothetical protein THF1C08_370009 [Vibrio jasicida]CAH1598555.1 hypothetical protein THF1A12_370009 [Vibrio jasicida]